MDDIFLLGVLFIVFVLWNLHQVILQGKFGAFVMRRMLLQKNRVRLDDPFLVRFFRYVYNWSSILTLGYHTVLVACYARDCFKATHNYDHWRSWPLVVLLSG